jgi:hypothetical protein
MGEDKQRKRKSKKELEREIDEHTLYQLSVRTELLNEAYKLEMKRRVDYIS